MHRRGSTAASKHFPALAGKPSAALVSRAGTMSQSGIRCMNSTSLKADCVRLSRLPDLPHQFIHFGGDGLFDLRREGPGERAIDEGVVPFVATLFEHATRRNIAEHVVRIPGDPGIA